MNNHLHIDEITAWTWIAGMALALLCLTAVILAGSDKFKMATVAPLASPMVQPMLMPPELIGEPNGGHHDKLVL